jgi:hypothetical protein
MSPRASVSEVVVATAGEYSSEPSSRTINLEAEAKYVARQRRTPTVVGLTLGAVFLIIGGYELGVLRGQLPFLDSVIAALLIVLGASIALVTLRGGLLNPVTSLWVDRDGLLFSRRWGPDVPLDWDDPEFYLDLQDPAPDPLTPAEDKQHLFFTSARGAYGSLPRAEVGPLLDTIQARDLTVRMVLETEGSGRARRRLRRVKVGAKPR